MGVIESVMGHDLNALQKCIDEGEDINVGDEANEGRTPAIIAAFYGDVPCLKALLSAGCSLDKMDDKGRTPATMAVEMGNDEVFSVLVDAGCDVTGIDFSSFPRARDALKRRQEGLVDES